MKRENTHKKNVVTRSVGTRETIQVDLTSMPVATEDLLILCTDGLSNMIEEDQIKNILKDWSSLDDKVETLINAANDAGGLDNISLILAAFSDREEG